MIDRRELICALAAADGIDLRRRERGAQSTRYDGRAAIKEKSI